MFGFFPRMAGRDRPGDRPDSNLHAWAGSRVKIKVTSIVLEIVLIQTFIWRGWNSSSWRPSHFKFKLESKLRWKFSSWRKLCFKKTVLVTQEQYENAILGNVLHFSWDRWKSSSWKRNLNEKPHGHNSSVNIIVLESVLIQIYMKRHRVKIRVKSIVLEPASNLSQKAQGQT